MLVGIDAVLTCDHRNSVTISTKCYTDFGRCGSEREVVKTYALSSNNSQVVGTITVN
jgi:hypothetical protein